MSRSICAGAVFLAIICVAAPAPFAPVRLCQAEKPTTAPAKPAASKLTLPDYIKIIKTSKDHSAILRAYTRACSIDRMNTELNSVYMRRMLLLGRPRTAYLSARILSNQDEDSGLAWAVIGYMLGRSNSYLPAMTATARSLEYGSDDESVLNNAGQLAAWFDNAPSPPRLGDREKRILDKLKDKFAKSKAYTDAYNRVNAVYVDCKTRRSALETKLTTAETQYNKARTEELTKLGAIKRINLQIIQQNKKIKEIEKDIRRNRNLLNARDEHGRYIYNHRSILAENTRLQNDLSAAERKKEDLRREGAPMMPEIRTAALLGVKLRKDISGYRHSLKLIKPVIQRKMRWDPPAVDGVFTPESTSLPRKTPVVKPKPTTQTATVVKPGDSEAAAAKKLKLAKLYISNNKPQKAREIIIKILEKYPRSKVAAEGRKLLESISP